MKIFELSHIGQFHVNHNEDFLVVEEAGNGRTLVAVMDGCSSGTDSHFASTLIGKLLRKIAKQEAYQAFIEKDQDSLDQQLERVGLQLFEELRYCHNLLDLRSDEILSTLILGLIDADNQRAEILVVGDGVIYCNGQYYEFENDNKPDYIGYHLNMEKQLWYQTRTTKKSFNHVKDLSICTDGIHTFKNFDGKVYPDISTEEIRNHFFIAAVDMDNRQSLHKIRLRIKREYGLEASDDLSMIRMIF